MKRLVWGLAILVSALTVPTWAQKAPKTPPASSNKGGAVTGLNRASQVQTKNKGAVAPGIATATKNASPEAGGAGSGAAHGKHKKLAKGKGK